METRDPTDISREYAGKCNSGGWGRDLFAAAREWLCTAITGISNDGGETWQVDYEFAYSERQKDGASTGPGWDEFKYYVDPTTGKPPATVEAINYALDEGVGTGGWKRIKHYKELDFTALNLETHTDFPQD